MAGFFSKLFSWVTGRGKGPPPTQEATRARPGMDKARQTVADEHERRAKQKLQEHGEPLTTAGLKAKIAAESAKILTDLGKKNAALLEKDRQEREERKAAQEARIIKASPEERFLAGAWRLIYQRDFQSTNPAKPAVYSVWYVPKEEAIYVQFHDNSSGAPAPGQIYKYWTFKPIEARQMYRASSKGIAVWDQMRVRGSRTAHKKNYALVG